MTAVLGAIVAGAVIALVAAGRPRITTGVAGEQVGGADTPVAAALALVALAGAAAVLLVRNRTRRLIGVLLVGVSVGIFAAFLATPEDVTYTVYTVADGGSELRRSAWVWLGALGAALTTLGALAVALRAGRWPEPRRRFEARAPARRGTEDPWDALDRGEDPTG
jgi:Tryptophan-associated transmembrane protein (Trp_oprn_chp)